jgi:hypothetical protein
MTIDRRTCLRERSQHGKSKHSGMVIISGPGGSGKTTTQAALMEVYVRCGIHCFAFCPTKTSTSHFRREHDKAFAAMAAKDPELKALQMAPLSKEEAHLFCAGKPNVPYAIQELEKHGVNFESIESVEADVTSMFDTIKRNRKQVSRSVRST